MYFKYSKKETDYLKQKDKVLSKAIDAIGKIKRPVDHDLFSSVIHTIVSQQISSAAKVTVWNRLVSKVDQDFTARSILAISRDEIQSCGISFRKTDSIRDFAEKVDSGEFDLEILPSLDDNEVIRRLSSLKGIGKWSAEMLLLFTMQRPNIISFGDLGILRGMRFLYGYDDVDRQTFDRHAAVYSPFGSVASLYLWAIAGGVLK
ncbi:MAG: DNA-3-methyladenine glycosylase 2 family protein [Leptonema sp. (in: Bacteria)]|nr:DNA-3-methyladenine glycosylase 2 family protein [Leptonema sp. (in: bacteria)]